MERVLTIKQKLGEKLDAFRSTIADQQATLREIADYRDSDVRAEASTSTASFMHRYGSWSADGRRSASTSPGIC